MLHPIKISQLNLSKQSFDIKYSSKKLPKFNKSTILLTALSAAKILCGISAR